MAEAPTEVPKKKIFRLKKSSTAAPTDQSEAPPPAQSVIITTVGDWAKQRQKSNRYTFTPQGDLVGPDQTIIEMNPKILASPEVIHQRLEERKAKIAEAEANFTKARRDLFQVSAQYRAQLATEGDVIRANQAVHTADCALALVAKYPRYIQRDSIYTFRDLHLDDFYNVRKFPDPVLEIEYTTFPIDLFWTDRQQEKIALEGLADEEGAPLEESQDTAKKNSARIGAIIAANRAKAMTGRA
jgi:hypothetical protein